MSDQPTQYTGERRRATDKLPLDIESMIVAEPDAKQRAFLIVLSAINQSLLANTSTVRDISIKLETHLDNFQAHASNEEAIINKGKGAWRILSYVLGAAQVVMLFLFTEVRTEFKDIDVVLKTAHKEHAIFSTRLKILESK